MSDGSIPYGRQSINRADIEAVVDVLQSSFLTTGPAVERFEHSVAEYVGASHAVAYSSGTAALHGAAWAAGWDRTSTVATSSLSFIASANGARFVGATLQFVDVDPRTLNLDPRRVPPGLSGLVPVHYAGLPVDLGLLDATPDVVIEDAAHALGAWTPDGPVGNCARSAMTCFSFHPVKPITSAEGGMVTTNDAELAERLRRFRTHGIEARPDHGGWYYEVSEIGYNYRLSDLQAALGASQMARLDTFVERRRELAERYDEGLADLPVTLPPQAPDGFGHGYHLYAIRTPRRRDVYNELRARGVLAQVHYVPIHHHPPYRRGDLCLPETDRAYERLLSLPIFPALTDAQQDRVVGALRDALLAAGVDV